MSKLLSDIPLSVLDLAVINASGSPANSFYRSLSLARKAESLGFKRFWMAEHHNMDSIASSATSILLGYIAGGTSTIRVGSGGIMLPNHAPLMVAEQFGTLESLYPGRIDLGLGRAPGTDQLTARALRRDEQSAYRFPQNVQELQRYFSVENRGSKVRAIPGEGLDIPIWILGSSTDSARMASMMGLPYAFASHFAPRQLHEAKSIYRSGFKPSSQLNHPYFMPCINVIAAETDREAEILATSAQKLFMGIITGERFPLQPPDEDFVMDPMAKAAMEQMTRYSFVGGPDTINRELTKFINETGADELMIVSHIYDTHARERSYEIVRELQKVNVR